MGYKSEDVRWNYRTQTTWFIVPNSVSFVNNDVANMADLVWEEKHKTLE